MKTTTKKSVKKIKEVDVYKLNHIDYKPRSKPQLRMLEVDHQNVFDVCLLGASGSGKTVAGIISSMGPQADGSFLTDRSEYRAIYLRRESVLLQRSGLLDAAEMWYKRFYPKVEFNRVEKQFTFPSGAKITFSGCEQESDKEKFKGFTELHAVVFEELTQFSQGIYEFIVSRLRTSTDIPLRVRSTTNPGDKHEEWVMNKYKYWITKSAEPIEKPFDVEWGEVLFYWANTDGVEVSKIRPKNIKSFSFCGIETESDDVTKDNRQFMAAQIVDPVQRAQLVDGIWGLKQGSGQYFSISDLVETTTKTSPSVRVRYWDSAASGPKGDYLSGALVAHTIDAGMSKFCIEDIMLVKAEPSEVANIIKQTAIRDGKQTFVAMEQEPASHSKVLMDLYQRDLKTMGFTMLVDIKRDSKLVRAQLISPTAKEHRISFIRCPMTDEMLKQLVNFPTKGIHDDAVDSISGAIFFLLHKLPRPVMIPRAKSGPPIDFKNLLGTPNFMR